MKRQKKKQTRGIILYNCIESFLLILSLLNSVVYPNIGTSVYFVFSLFLTALCLTRDEKKIRIKQIFSIAIMVIAVGISITKTVFIVNLHKQGQIRLDEDDTLMYKTCGIYIHLSTSKIGVINVFMSVFFDLMEFFICIFLTILYGNQRHDARLVVKPDGSGPYLLNPNFEKHQGKFCVAAIVFLTIDAIMIQTVF